MAETYPAYAETSEQRPRRRRWPLVLAIILLLVLGGLFVVADRAAAGFAERAVADQVRQEIAKQDAQASSPQVTVGGFPFLTQVVAGRYESISIRLPELQVAYEGNTIDLSGLDVKARNVRASLDTLRSGTGAVTAQTVESSATLAYDSLVELIGRPGLTLAEQGGKLLVTAPFEAAGKQFTVTGTAEPRVGNGRLLIRFSSLTSADLPRLPQVQALLGGYARQISLDVDLSDLPLNLEVRDVRALPEGLAVTAVATDVPLNSFA